MSSNPLGLFQSIYGDYLHGNLEAAGSRAEKARQEFSSGGSGRDPSWELKFRLLEAEILLRENHPKEVIALLIGGVSFPSEGDLAIKRNVLCGLAHSRVGELADSERELREARRLAEAAHSALIGEVLRAEALIQRDAGNWPEAVKKFASSLAVAREHGDPLLQAADLVDIGYASLHAEHYDQALVLSQEAANYSRSVQARRQLQLALGNMGWAYYNLGDFENALSNFQGAEQQAKEIGMVSYRVLWLQDAGLADYKLGNLDEARKYDEEALQSALTLPATAEIDQVANIETNLALLHYQQGQYDAAQTDSDRAALAAQNSKDANVIAYARFLQGLLAARLVNDPAAERLLMEARQLATDADLRTDIEDTMANWHSGRGESRQAQLWYRRAIRTFEEKRSSVHDEALRLSAFSYGDAAYRDYAEFLINCGKPGEALQLLDRSRARTLEEGLGLARAAPDARAKDVADSQARAKDVADSEARAKDVADSQARAKDVADSQARTKDVADSQARGKDVADSQGVAAKLDARILFYSLGPRRSHLWAISARETRLFTLPPQKEIESLIDEYQRAIQKSSDPLKTASPVAIALYEALIKPAAAMIPHDSRIFLVPDGALHALNFETLLEPGAGGLKYWIEEVTVTTTSSIRILSRSNAAAVDAAGVDAAGVNAAGVNAVAAKTGPASTVAASTVAGSTIAGSTVAAKATTRDLLLIGDPLSAGREFEALPNASAEIQHIQQHFSPEGQTVLTQARAVPAAYTASAPDQYRYIHFVAHGTASRSSPLESAVVLSPAQNPADFKLYARDIVQYPLRARLVTISACYGSGLRTYTGEGLVGLAWAFLRAGSHNVIGALWEADDAATPLLMDRLYAELEAGKTPDAALRIAKLALINSTGVYRKPFYWGVFQLYAGA